MGNAIAIWGFGHMANVKERGSFREFSSECHEIEYLVGMLGMLKKKVSSYHYLAAIAF
jgi:hypothetical protein